MLQAYRVFELLWKRSVQSSTRVITLISANRTYLDILQRHDLN